MLRQVVSDYTVQRSPNRHPELGSGSISPFMLWVCGTMDAGAEGVQRTNEFRMTWVYILFGSRMTTP